jgi:hypothetical protein
MLAQYKRGVVLAPTLPMAGMTNHIRPKEKKGEGAALPLGQPNQTGPGPRLRLWAAPTLSNCIASPPPAFATWQICRSRRLRRMTFN